MAISTLRPGLLVNLSTSCRGNVRYDKVDITPDVEPLDGEDIAQWETTRTIADAAEHERARKAQNEARGIISRVCNWTAFGLLCPEADTDKLNRAMEEAQAVVDEFNSTAHLTRLRVHVMVGKIAADDVEAVRKINREVRELIDDMAIGIQKLDVKQVREAAEKARLLGNMLSPDANVRVAVAIKTARDAATAINAAGEAAARAVDQNVIDQLKAQRTAFLDLSDEVEVERPVTQGRAIDLAPEVQ